MFPNEKARLMRMMDSHGVPSENESGVKMDFTQRVTWLIDHANQQSVKRTCFYCEENKAPAKEAICQDCVDLLSDASR